MHTMLVILWHTPRCGQHVLHGVSVKLCYRNRHQRKCKTFTPKHIRAQKQQQQVTTKGGAQLSAQFTAQTANGSNLLEAIVPMDVLGPLKCVVLCLMQVATMRWSCTQLG